MLPGEEDEICESHEMGDEKDESVVETDEESDDGEVDSDTMSRPGRFCFDFRRTPMSFRFFEGTENFFKYFALNTSYSFGR